MTSATEPQHSVDGSADDIGAGRRIGLGWWALAALIVLALSFVGALAGGVLGKQIEANANRQVPLDGTALPQQLPGDTSPQPGTVAALAAQALPGVVALSIDTVAGSGSGSGFVISTDGYIVTNNHVIDAAVRGEGAARIEVVFFDGSRADASIVGRNVSYDLAVLEVDLPDGIPALPWGDDGEVRVGDGVIAIGSPLGLQGTVTQGIVSALNRPVSAGGTTEGPSYIDAIQTDASINPGNSGGPLLDGAGLVIGVNAANATEALGSPAGSIGLGFAIPASDAQRIASELIDTGTSTTPVIGVSLDSTYPGPGALISEVNPDTPAAAAGLQVGDVIIAIDGRRVPDALALITAIRANAPGDVVELTVVRGVREFVVPVTLQARSDVP